jgi:hypothetical protein
MDRYMKNQRERASDRQTDRKSGRNQVEKHNSDRRDNSIRDILREYRLYSLARHKTHTNGSCWQQGFSFRGLRPYQFRSNSDVTLHGALPRRPQFMVLIFDADIFC